MSVAPFNSESDEMRTKHDKIKHDPITEQDMQQPTPVPLLPPDVRDTYDCKYEHGCVEDHQSDPGGNGGRCRDRVEVPITPEGGLRTINRRLSEILSKHR